MDESPSAGLPALTRRRSKQEAEDLQWEAWTLYISGQCRTHADVAVRLGIGEKYVHKMITRARSALQTAREFDPTATNLQQQMLKFLPLAADALERSLIKAEPRVLVAYLQGVRALVPQQEIATITAEEMARSAKSALKAMNPRLRESLKIDAEITTVEVDEKPE